MQKMQEISAKWKGQLISGISISYGIATAHEHSNFDLVMKEADEKMYESKRNYYKAWGRNRRRHPDEPTNTLEDMEKGFAV